VEQLQDNTPLTYKKANGQLTGSGALHGPLRGCSIRLRLLVGLFFPGFSCDSSPGPLFCLATDALLNVANEA